MLQHQLLGSTSVAPNNMLQHQFVTINQTLMQIYVTTSVTRIDISSSEQHVTTSVRYNQSNTNANICYNISYSDRHVTTSATLNNQSIKIYIAPFPDPYSEALPTQARRKRTALVELRTGT